MASFRYPDISPVGSGSAAGLTGLGANWNRGGEGLTRWVDYIKFQGYALNYDGAAILESFKNSKDAENTARNSSAGKELLGDSVYLYMPANIAVSYQTSYNQVAFGVGGIMAAQMLGASSSTEIAEALKNAAGGAAPEAAFSAVGDAIGGLNQVIGVGGQVSGNDLAAVSQGRIFNPFEEQVFQGVSFRTHQFDFKLVARDKKEAENIDGIIRFFKILMLPSYDGDIGNPDKPDPPKNTKTTDDAPKKDDAEKKNDKTVAEKISFAGAGERRYLKVPGRVKVEFVRINTTNGQLGATSASLSTLFKLKDCVVESMQVNYTPDGGYVNTDEGYVPALQLQMTLKEVALVTAEDAKAGY